MNEDSYPNTLDPNDNARKKSTKNITRKFSSLDKNCPYLQPAYNKLSIEQVNKFCILLRKRDTI